MRQNTNYPFGRYFDIDSPEGEFKMLFEQANIVEQMQKDMLKKGLGTWQ